MWLEYLSYVKKTKTKLNLNNTCTGCDVFHRKHDAAQTEVPTQVLLAVPVGCNRWSRGRYASQQEDRWSSQASDPQPAGPGSGAELWENACPSLAEMHACDWLPGGASDGDSQEVAV